VVAEPGGPTRPSHVVDWLVTHQDNLSPITEVAEALIERGELTGAEVAAIVEVKGDSG
jgi:hypothetical protein